MPTSLLLLLVLLASPSESQAASISPAVNEPDLCRDASLLPGGETCGDGPLCSPKERVGIACEMREAMLARYVYLDLKPLLLDPAEHPGRDVRRHLKECVEAEKAIPDESDPLLFFDRMRACVGALEDGHLILTVPGQLPVVALGVGLRLTGDGAVRVANRSPALLRYLESEGKIPRAGELLALGTPVVAVDGVPVADALESLGKLVPASSRGARMERAVDALTRRNFAYPRAREARLTVLHEGRPRDIILPWWVTAGVEKNPYAAPWNSRTGLPTTDLIDFIGGAFPSTDPEAGLSRGDSVLDSKAAQDLKVFQGDVGQIAARLGESCLPDGHPICYLQLLTFQTGFLASSGEKRPFVEVLEAFLRGCQAKKLDLVLDLRQNEGGYLSHATALSRLLLPAGVSAPAGALLLRATERNEAVFKDRLPPLSRLKTLVSATRSESEVILEGLRDSLKRGAPFAPAYLERGRGEGVYLGKLAVLVTPSCMSACDRLARMLKVSGRAVLVGGPSEGAGGSQQETNGIGARWVDTEGRLGLSIPNAAMGVGKDMEASTVDPALFVSALALENRPVQPDLSYAASLEDIRFENRGWRAAALRAFGLAERKTTVEAPTPAPIAEAASARGDPSGFLKRTSP